MEMSSTSDFRSVNTGTAKDSIAMPTAANNDTGDMSGMGNDRKISMLWNWNTIDSCFVSSAWQIKSSGTFAGSCIGVLLLVVVLEALRRASYEYDAYIMRLHLKKTSSSTITASRLEETASDSNKTPSTQSTTPLLQPQIFTPNIFQQLIRAFLHMAQFVVAYIVMLFAMYYNGYIIICIFLGAFLGAFIFSWHGMVLRGDQRAITYCCG